MSSFSYSALSSAARCETLYRFQFIDKIPQPTAPSGDMSFGTAIHLGLEGILTGGDGVADFSLFWEIEKSKPNKYGRFNWGDLKTQGEKLLTRFERLHSKKFKEFQMEQRLYGLLPSGHSIEGTPDFLGTYMNVPCLIDFKTSGSRYNKDRIKTSQQLYLYAHLARTVLKYPVEQILYYVFVKGNEPSIQTICSPLDESLMKFHLDNSSLQIESLLKIAETKNYTKNPANCLMGELKCSYFDLCYGSKPVTGEEIK